ncbi:transposase [Vibrio cyclitrophicus]
MGLESVDVWFQDEARFGQQNTTTRLWAPRGTRPRVVKLQQFEYAYLFGSVCPSKGIDEAMVVLWVNKDIMINHLEQISKVTEKNCHSVVIMDGILMTLLTHLIMSVSFNFPHIRQSLTR